MNELRTDSDRRISKLQVQMLVSLFGIWVLGLSAHAYEIDELQTDSDRRISKLKVKLRFIIWGSGLGFRVLTLGSRGYPQTEVFESQLQRQSSESQTEGSLRTLKGSVRILDFRWRVLKSYCNELGERRITQD